MVTVSADDGNDKLDAPEGGARPEPRPQNNEPDPQNQNPPDGTKPAANEPDGKGADDVVDETGVPWKNRFLELKRKTEKQQKQGASAPQSYSHFNIDAINPALSANNPNLEEYWRKREDETGLDRKTLFAMDKSAFNMASAVRVADDRANSVMRINVDAVIEETPKLDSIRERLTSALQQYSPADRADINFIRTLAERLYGRHMLSDDAQPTPAAPKSNVGGIADGTNLMRNKGSGTPPAGGGGVILTAAEREFADDYGLVGRFTNQEIRDMHKKRTKT